MVALSSESTFETKETSLMAEILLRAQCERSSYLATASLYTNPAVALRTTSKHKSEPSILKQKRDINA